MLTSFGSYGVYMELTKVIMRPETGCISVATWSNVGGF